MKIKATLAAVVLGLVGCKSTPEVIEPRPLDTNASYAFNVANQTVLTRNNSPLRDFTLDESEEIQLSRPDGGDASLFFGTLSILTGDLTGAISVAGGAAANIANSEHPSSISRWIVVVPTTKFNDKDSFQRFVIESIEKANTETLAELTGKEIDVVLREATKTYFYSIGGVENGWAYKKNMNDLSRSWVDSTVNYNGESIYIYGNERLAYGVSPFAYIDKDNPDSYEEYLKSVTSKLPHGFYYYSTSYPQAWAQDNKLYNVFEPVPAIYTQGKKYEFIKPE